MENKRLLLATRLTVCLLALLTATTVRALTPKSGDFWDEDTKTLTYNSGLWYGYNTEIVHLIIGKNVTSIGSSAFSKCTNLKTVTFENGSTLTSIGYSAFDGCSSLQSIVIPAGVTSIGTYAFNGCSSLESIVIPASVTSIGKKAFSFCTSLESIVIPAGVTSIGDRAFVDSNLKTVTFENGSALSNIGDMAFGGCSLETIVIPAGVTSIGSSAFFRCTNLQTVTFENGSTLSSIGESAFSSCSSLESIMIPAGVTSIENWVFEGCSSLETIMIPAGVMSIGSYAFKGCSSLETIVIPAGVTSIGSSAFSSCTNLQAVTFENGATLSSIGSYAFKGCSSLETIVIPAGVTSIGSSAFDGCSSLETIVIPAGVTSIGSSAFEGCSSIESIVIPAGVMSIGYSTFEGCSSLESIVIPAGVTSIGSAAFKGCTNLQTVTFENGSTLTSIGTNAFTNTKWYNDHADGQLYLDNWLLGYKGSEPIGVFEIAVGTKGIASSAFAGCQTVTSVTIPASVTYIGENSFADCTNLSAITVDDGNPKYLSEDGVLFNKDITELIQYPAGKDKTEYTIPASVTSIGSLAFSSCYSLESIAIPTSVTTIGAATFYGCTRLVSIAIPASVTTIDPVTFAGCNSLKVITIPASVTVIGFGAFSNCENVTDVYCYADPTNLIWEIGYGEYDGFKENKATVCHVADASAWSSFSDANVTFVGDLVGTAPVTANAAEGAYWSTYYNGTQKVKAEAGATVYTAKVSGDQVALVPVADGIIPAGQGVVLKSNSPAVNFLTTSDAPTGDFADNELQGVDVRTAVATAMTGTLAGLTPYVMGNKNDHFGFHKYTGANLPAQKAFLALNSASAARLTMVFDENVTGIKNTVLTSEADAWYTLDGQRLSGKPTKRGMYINNGNKVVIK
ncbi:MAG: leucine-rich repeat domain-containing protein [Prevotella sp.]|nr:leucine-rich repeat domain-containing protein [Prevotella sp.]